jgi:hypothetical protein
VRLKKLYLLQPYSLAPISRPEKVISQKLKIFVLLKDLRGVTFKYLVRLIQAHHCVRLAKLYRLHPYSLAPISKPEKVISQKLKILVRLKDLRGVTFCDLVGLIQAHHCVRQAKLNVLLVLSYRLSLSLKKL